MSSALLPSIIGAIMGSGANPAFTGAEGQLPFAERKTGLGRFMQRYGGFDPGAANANYTMQRSMIDRSQDRADQRYGQGMQHQLQLENIRNQFADQRFQQSQAARAAERSEDIANERFMRFGTQDPILQNLRANELGELSVTGARNNAMRPTILGQGAFIPAGTEDMIFWNPESDPTWDFNTGQMIPGRPRTLEREPISGIGRRPSTTPAQNPAAADPAAIDPAALQRIEQMASAGGTTQPGLIQRVMQSLQQFKNPALAKPYTNPASQPGHWLRPF